MNGKISTTAVQGIVTRTFAEFIERTGAECSVEGARALMFRLGEMIEKASRVDIDEVAYDVVDRDMRGSDVGTVHKILDIKEVRTITMTGLKEAKDAVEYAIGRVLRDRANAALDALKAYNETGDGSRKYAYRQYVSAVNYADVLSDLWSAANDPNNTPF